MAFGQWLVDSADPINPFAPPPYASGRGAPASPPVPAMPSIQPTVGPPPDQQKERFAGWKSFFQKVKTDPNTRAALAQFFVGLSQPADNPQAAVGQAMNAGVRTLGALQDRDYQRTRETAADTRAERQVGATEKGVELEGQRLEQQGDQFNKNFSQEGQQARDNLQLKRQELASSEAYQKELLALRRAELDVQRGEQTAGSTGGVQGAMWTRLRDAILADPLPELQAIADPAARKSRAEVIAFDMINKPGQTREKMMADFIASQLLFLPDPEKDPTGYAEGIQRVMSQAGAIADSADLRSRSASPVPGSPPTPGQTPTAAPSSAAPPPQPTYRTGGTFGAETPVPGAAVAPPAGPAGSPAPGASALLDPTSMTEEQLRLELEELMRRGQPLQQ